MPWSVPSLEEVYIAKGRGSLPPIIIPNATSTVQDGKDTGTKDGKRRTDKQTGDHQLTLTKFGPKPSPEPM